MFFHSNILSALLCDAIKQSCYCHQLWGSHSPIHTEPTAKNEEKGKIKQTYTTTITKDILYIL